MHGRGVGGGSLTAVHAPVEQRAWFRPTPTGWYQHATAYCIPAAQKELHKLSPAAASSSSRSSRSKETKRASTSIKDVLLGDEGARRRLLSGLSASGHETAGRALASATAGAARRTSSTGGLQDWAASAGPSERARPQ